MRKVFLVILCLGIAGCRSESAKEGSEEGAEALPPAPVRVAAVREGEVNEVVRATGETRALSILRLASPAAGRVTFLAVHPGDRVKQGETVARILPLESEAAIAGFQVLERAHSLGPGGGEQAAKLERELRAREVALPAPFPAVVGERAKNPGEQVAAGDVLVELFDPRSLVVVAQVPQKLAARLRPGMSVTAEAGMQTLRGRVSNVLPSISAPSLTVPVRVALDVPLDPPLLGAAVDCEIALGEARRGLLVPRSAVLVAEPPAETRVMVASAGHAHLKKVEVAIRSGDDVEIKSGLEAGEQVLVEGQLGLADGAAIRIEEQGSAAAEKHEGRPSAGAGGEAEE